TCAPFPRGFVSSRAQTPFGHAPPGNSVSCPGDIESPGGAKRSFAERRSQTEFGSERGSGPSELGQDEGRASGAGAAPTAGAGRKRRSPSRRVTPTRSRYSHSGTAYLRVVP